MEVWILIVIPILILIFILLSALFSSSETALSSVDISEINALKKSKKKKVSRKAANVLFLVDDFNGTITSILIFNNLVNIINTALVTLFFESLFGAAGVLVAVIMMTILIITFSEILPKIFAKRNSLKFSMNISGTMKRIYYVTYPVNLFFKKIVRDENYIGGDAERRLVNEISHLNEKGEIKNKNAEWLKNLVNLQKLKLKDIMIPKVRVQHLHSNSTKDEIIDLFNNYKLSRVPILKKDHKKVIGVLNMKVYFSLYVENKASEINIKDIMTKPITIPKSMSLSDTLQILQSNGKYFGIVTKSERDLEMIGIITIEDIIEQIVGGLSDSVNREKDGIEKLGIDIFIVKDNAKVKYLFTEYLKNVKTPTGIDDDTTFIDWMIKKFTIHNLIENNHYSYKNISIWIKKDPKTKEIFFEIDLH